MLPGPSSQNDTASHRRKMVLRLTLLVLLFCVSLYFFVVLPHRMKTLPSLAAFLAGLFSFLGMVFTLLGMVIRRGYAPGWQIRCPQCGLTVNGSTCMVRIGAAGTERRWGWCDRCKKHTWLVIEPIPPGQDASNEEPRSQKNGQ